MANITVETEQQQFNPLEQFLREQEIAKAKVAAARGNLVSYFQKRLQALADEWRSLNGVLNWQMPEFGQALDELQLRPVTVEVKTKSASSGHKRGPRPSIDWETRRLHFEAFADKEGLLQKKLVPDNAITSKDIFYQTVRIAVANGHWEKVRSGRNSIWKVKRPLAT